MIGACPIEAEVRVTDTDPVWAELDLTSALTTASRSKLTERVRVTCATAGIPGMETAMLESDMPPDTSPTFPINEESERQTETWADVKVAILSDGDRLRRFEPDKLIEQAPVVGILVLETELPADAR